MKVSSSGERNPPVSCAAILRLPRPTHAGLQNLKVVGPSGKMHTGSKENTKGHRRRKEVKGGRRETGRTRGGERRSLKKQRKNTKIQWIKGGRKTQQCLEQCSKGRERMIVC